MPESKKSGLIMKEIKKNGKCVAKKKKKKPDKRGTHWPNIRQCEHQNN